MVETIDRKYLAGLIDGEGCIQMKGSGFASLILTLANTYKPIIDRLYAEFGGNIREYLDKRQLKSGRFRKPVYFWRLCGFKAEVVLRECYPYLIIKKEHVEIVLFIRSSIHMNYREVPFEEMERRKALKASLDKLNEKGVVSFGDSP